MIIKTEVELAIMKLNSVTTFIVNKIIGMSYEDATEYLESMGFSIIGRGCESVVYSKKGFEYVIKLQTWQKPKSVPCDKHFANQVMFDGGANGNYEFNVIVQEKCVSIKPAGFKEATSPLYKRCEKFKKFLENKFNVWDIHDFNMGIRNGRLVSIDWNMDY